MDIEEVESLWGPFKKKCGERKETETGMEVDMNIVEALRLLELNGGHIKRSSSYIGIYMYEGDEWPDFEMCRVVLSIEDLTATDWEHFWVVRGKK